MPLSALDIFALSYMIVIWLCYARYAKYRAKHTNKPSLSRSLKSHREAWVHSILRREMRMTDSNLLGNQERVVGFFASTTLLLLAAVISALTSSELVRQLAAGFPYAVEQTDTIVQIKFFCLAVLLVLAFFNVTWSLRQYGFANVMMGSLPDHLEPLSDADRNRIVKQFTKLLDSAGHDNNNALRGYYFGIAMVFWLFHPILFIFGSTVVVGVLFTRECHSTVVHSITESIYQIDKTKQPLPTESTNKPLSD